MMIPANELRIGNYGQLWHFWSSRWTAIIKLTGEHIFWLSQNKTDFNPVKLTPEILVKSGFYIDSKYGRLISNGRLDMLNWYADNLRWCYRNKIDQICTIVTLEYVHQLQNLYFCLCKEELEIKL